MRQVPRLCIIGAVPLLLAALLTSCNSRAQVGVSPTSAVLRPTPSAERTTSATPYVYPTSATQTLLTTPELQRFHYRVVLDFRISAPDLEGDSKMSMLLDGVFVAPDSHSFTATFDVGGLPYTADVVVRGDDAWRRQDAGAWVKTTRLDRIVREMLDLVPVEMLLASPGELRRMSAVVPGTPDTVEGLTTRRFEIPSNEAVKGFSSGFGQEFLAGGVITDPTSVDMTVWLEEDTYYPVQVAISMTFAPEYLGTSIQRDAPPGTLVDYESTVTITQHNDPGIEIVPPAAPR